MTARTSDQVGTGASRPKISARDPILAAKITTPDVSDWAVPRPRITKLITQGTRWCPLTVVTGPPGAGKTMALASWAAAEPGPVAWLSLDEYDNRPGTFWSYVIAALGRAGIAVPRQPPAARGQAGGHVFLLRLASALAARDGPVRLVLDDFHAITQPKIAAGLDFVLRNTGPGLRLAISSRMDPRLPLHRYRLAGELAEIRAGDLAFTVDEAGLLMDRHGSPLPARSLEDLTRRTEGWAAGLRLAALSMDTHPDPDQFVKGLVAEDSAVTSYLAEEVLKAAPPEAREVLLCTSILEHVSPEAASDLTGNAQAGRILADLARTNAFVQPVGSGWYRYHAMFAEVLRLKLRHESGDRMPELQRRAASWYQRHGALTGAVRHAARAGDWQLATSMVIDRLAVSEIIGPGRTPSLADEFASMPPPHAGDQPEPYLVFAAVELSSGRPESSSVALGSAEDLLERRPADQEPAARLAAAMIRLAIARRTGSLTAAAAAAARATAVASTIPADKLALHPELRARLLSGRGAVELWSGRLGEAARTLEAAVAVADTAGADTAGAGFERGEYLGQLALVEALRGRPERAADLASQATEALTVTTHEPQALHMGGAALLALALAHLECDELRQAGAALKQVNAALSASPDALLSSVACLVAARAYLAAGHTATATQYLAKARSGWCVPGWLDERLSLPRRPAAGVSRPPRLVLAQHNGPPAREGRDKHPASLNGPAPARMPVVVEPLTQREQEVLRHVSGMLSTAEVASEMYISTNTVKAHLKSAFRKLGAAHRGEAVRRARQLELI